MGEGRTGLDGKIVVWPGPSADVSGYLVQLSLVPVEVFWSQSTSRGERRMVTKEVRGINIHNAYLSWHPQLTDTPVVTLTSFAATFPAIHPLTVIGVSVGIPDSLMRVNEIVLTRKIVQPQEPYRQSHDWLGQSGSQIAIEMWLP